MPDKTAESCGDAYMEFAGPNDYKNELYTDGSSELVMAPEDAKWIHSTSTHGRLERNDMAERAVRSVKDDARAILLRAGLTERFWPKAIRLWCFSRNVRKFGVGLCSGRPLARTSHQLVYQTAPQSQLSRDKEYLSALWWISSRPARRRRNSWSSPSRRCLALCSATICSLAAAEKRTTFL